MRQLSPYEQNHLRRHGIDPETIGEYVEMPVEYITGFAEFYGREFVVDRSVMIPRVESEGLIRLALEELSVRRTTNHERRTICFADLGTGSGCIGITLYLELEARGVKPEAYLSDISKDALRIAQKNVDHLVPNPHDIHLLQSDLLTNYELSNHEPRTMFDLIVANLPYIPSPRISTLDSSVKDYELHLALDGGLDGLSVIKKFLEQSLQYLKKNGFIIIEVDESHRPEQLRNREEFSINVHRDSFGKNRFWVLTLR